MARDTKKKEEYIEAVGRRKSATARVRLFDTSSHTMEINGKNIDEYFPGEIDRSLARAALAVVSAENMSVEAKVTGGGVHAQAEAIRLGIARALVKKSEESRHALRQAGFLKRDPREKERRKFGLKKARKASQWSKR